MAPKTYSNSNRPDPAESATAVTPSDSTDLDGITRGLYIGGAGTLVCTPWNNADGDQISFVGLPAGSILPLRVKRVFTTSTCTSIVALF